MRGIYKYCRIGHDIHGSVHVGIHRGVSQARCQGYTPSQPRFRDTPIQPFFSLVGFNASATARVISRRWNDDEISFLVEETGVPGGNHRQVTDETFHTYGLCPVRGLTLGRSGVKQSELNQVNQGPGIHTQTTKVQGYTPSQPRSRDTHPVNQGSGIHTQSTKVQGYTPSQPRSRDTPRQPRFSDTHPVNQGSGIHPVNQGPGIHTQSTKVQGYTQSTKVQGYTPSQPRFRDTPRQPRFRDTHPVNQGPGIHTQPTKVQGYTPSQPRFRDTHPVNQGSGIHTQSTKLTPIFKTIIWITVRTGLIFWWFLKMLNFVKVSVCRHAR